MYYARYVVVVVVVVVASASSRFCSLALQNTCIIVRFAFDIVYFYSVASVGFLLLTIYIKLGASKLARSGATVLRDILA